MAAGDMCPLIESCEMHSWSQKCPMNCLTVHLFIHELHNLFMITASSQSLLMCFVFCITCRNEEGLASAKRVLQGLGLDPSVEDCICTQRVCQIVSTRAAHLCAAALVAILRQIRDNKAVEKLRTTIGVDGSVYKNHPE